VFLRASACLYLYLCEVACMRVPGCLCTFVYQCVYVWLGVPLYVFVCPCTLWCACVCLRVPLRVYISAVACLYVCVWCFVVISAKFGSACCVDCPNRRGLPLQCCVVVAFVSFWLKFSVWGFRGVQEVLRLGFSASQKLLPACSGKATGKACGR
jgi:hypothetical protein